MSRAITASMVLPSLVVRFVDVGVMRFVVLAAIVVPMTLTAYALWRVLGSAVR
jgi:hypothetical protein